MMKSGSEATQVRVGGPVAFARWFDDRVAPWARSSAFDTASEPAGSERFEVPGTVPPEKPVAAMTAPMSNTTVAEERSIAGDGPCVIPAVPASFSWSTADPRSDPTGGSAASPAGSLPGWDDDGFGSETSPEMLDMVETMPPGPFLGILLAGVDPATLSELDRTRFLQAQARMVAHHQARLLEAMVAVYDAAADRLDDDTMKDVHAAEDAAAEIAVALHLTRRAADRDLHTALGLRRRLPQVSDALASGTLDRRRAGVILHGTDHLPIGEARQVTHQIVDRAAGWTTGQLRARLRRLCLQVDPDTAADRYRQALTRRRVILRGAEEGTAHLGGFDLPPDRAAEARDRIEALARGLHRDGETRSLDQLRADVYLDLLCGTLTTAADRTRGGIHLTVDVPTLAGMVDTCGELEGFGPIVADVARQITLNHTDDTWTWAVTHPDTGAVLADGTTRRRPTTRQRRHLTTRRRTCCFPGCRMPAIDCDLDHTIPWAHGGRTRCANLGPLCRHHHRLHHRGWRYIIDPDGRIHWTSPLGQTTTVHPDGQSRPPP